MAKLMKYELIVMSDEIKNNAEMQKKISEARDRLVRTGGVKIYRKGTVFIVDRVDWAEWQITNDGKTSGFPTLCLIGYIETNPNKEIALPYKIFEKFVMDIENNEIGCDSDLSIEVQNAHEDCANGQEFEDWFRAKFTKGFRIEATVKAYRTNWGLSRMNNWIAK